MNIWARDECEPDELDTPLAHALPDVVALARADAPQLRSPLSALLLAAVPAGCSAPKRLPGPPRRPLLGH